MGVSQSTSGLRLVITFGYRISNSIGSSGHKDRPPLIRPLHYRRQLPEKCLQPLVILLFPECHLALP